MIGKRLVAVVGGGMSGLAAAHRLTTLPSAPRVVLLEAGTQLGGNLRSARVAGVKVDAGPDSLLARVPWALQLLDELGLRTEVVEPAPLQAHIWARGRLRPLPTGLMTGHARGAAIRRSGLLSARGQLRAALDLAGFGGPPLGDESVAAALGSRLGREVVEAVAEPLLGGVYAGSAERLSSRAVTPSLAAARARGGSLLRSMRAEAEPPASAGPALVSLKGGLWRLPDAIAATLAASGCDIRLSSKVVAVSRGPEGMTVSLHNGERLEADSVVLALPAGPTAELLAPSVPGAAATLGAIDHASVAIVTLAFSASELPALPASSGFLVANGQGLAIKACTFTSQKWPQVQANGLILLRCSLGRAGETLPAHDAELIAAARRDLHETLKIDAQPIDAGVSRFVDALPQPTPGHLDRIATAESEIEGALPRIAVAGAWLRGIGLAACIREGRAAADSAIIRAEPTNRGR